MFRWLADNAGAMIEVEPEGPAGPSTAVANQLRGGHALAPGLLAVPGPSAVLLFVAPDPWRAGEWALFVDPTAYARLSLLSPEDVVLLGYVACAADPPPFARQSCASGRLSGSASG